MVERNQGLFDGRENGQGKGLRIQETQRVPTKASDPLQKADQKRLKISRITFEAFLWLHQKIWVLFKRHLKLCVRRSATLYFLCRFDEMMAKVNDTKTLVDCLWKSYQYTDELTPLMEWLEENVSKSTREINSSSASETEWLRTSGKTGEDPGSTGQEEEGCHGPEDQGRKDLDWSQSPQVPAQSSGQTQCLWADANKAAEDRLKQLKGRNSSDSIPFTRSNASDYLLNWWARTADFI